jgi:hypothetical protein
MTQLITLEGDRRTSNENLQISGRFQNPTIDQDGNLSGDFYPDNFSLNGNDHSLNGELGKFKFNFKSPKMPKFRAPKMKVNTKGLSRGFKSAGKAVSKGVKAYGNAWKKVGKGLEKGLKSAGKAAGQLAESLLDQDAGQQEPEEQEEQQNQEQEEMMDEGQNQEQEEMIDEEPEEMNGYHYNNTDELGFMSMLTNMASGGGGKGGGGILSMATGALDMVVPGAGTVANIGIGAAQKQRQKQKAKKAKKQQMVSQFSNRFLESRNNKNMQRAPRQASNINQIKQSMPIQQRQSNIKQPVKQSMAVQPMKFSVSPQTKAERFFDWGKEPEPVKPKGFLETPAGMITVGAVVIGGIYFITKKGKK